jgi:hypothetical protein
MEILIHTINKEKIAEIISDNPVIIETQDALDLMGDLYSQGTNKIILLEKHLSPAFFDLKTKLAGEILQKFSNYNFKLAIIGDFSKYKSKSLHDFILESNKSNRIFFLEKVEDALLKLTGNNKSSS